MTQDITPVEAPPEVTATGAGAGSSRLAVRIPPALRERLRAALGGALVLAALVSMIQWWSEGVRPATMADLARDTESGLVAQWFPANSLSSSSGTTRALRPSGPVISDSGIGPGNTGLFIVWQTKDHGLGMGHWRIASPLVDVFHGTGSGGTGQDPRIEAATKALEALPDATRVQATALPSTSPPQWVWALWLIAVFVFFVGRPPVVGSRWFWFWLTSFGGPAIAAYAVTELIGWRPSTWPQRRLSGLVGFASATLGSIGLGMILMVLLPWARTTLGLDVPL